MSRNGQRFLLLILIGIACVGFTCPPRNVGASDLLPPMGLSRPLSSRARVPPPAVCLSAVCRAATPRSTPSPAKPRPSKLCLNPAVRFG